uniref:Uncharacterized protein n=1 Tax=Hanusia phi TaxID=3032 RepID=A0A7S0E054_9CRYP
MRQTRHSAPMEWSREQGAMVSGGGRIERLYDAPRFPWQEEELPHFHKVRGSTHADFGKWKKERRTHEIVVGAWFRPLFLGGWIHSDATTESVYNLQTPSLFIDLRIPNLQVNERWKSVQGMSELSDDDLRLLARRHCFAGYSLLNEGPWTSQNPPVCTRHHSIDWNFVGKMRPRPNKWRIEMREDGKVWKEWGYAKDEFDQHIYLERWELLPEGKGRYLAIRRDERYGRDAILIVCGNHFNFVMDRPTKMPFDPERQSHASLQDLVDKLVQEGNREEAMKYLSLEGCHGRVSGANAWVVDNALHPWKIGKRLLSPDEVMVKYGENKVMWKGEQWHIVEDSFGPYGLLNLFAGTLVDRRSAL